MFQVLEHTVDTATWQQVQHVWDSVLEHRPLRVNIIERLSVGLRDIEAERSKQTAAVIRDSGAVLKSVASLLPPEVNDLVFAEAQQVNKAMLGNLRAIADVHARLCTAEVALERELQVRWDRIAKSWAASSQQQQLAAFSSRLEDELSRFEDGAREELSLLRRERVAEASRCTAALQHVRLLVPPRLSRRMANDWHATVTSATDALAAASEQRCLALEDRFESLQGTLARLKSQLEADLVRRNTCAATEASGVVAAAAAPAEARALARAAAVLQPLRDACRGSEAANAEGCGKVVTLVEAVAAAWEAHEDALVAEQEAVAGDIAGMRAKCDADREAAERKLDLHIDTLRQAGPDELEATMSAVRSEIRNEEAQHSLFGTQAAHRAERYVADAAGLQEHLEVEMMRLLQVEPLEEGSQEQDPESAVVLSDGSTFRILAPAGKPRPASRSKTPKPPSSGKRSVASQRASSAKSVRPGSGVDGQGEPEPSGPSSSEQAASLLADVHSAAEAGTLSGAQFAACVTLFKKAVLEAVRARAPATGALPFPTAPCQSPTVLSTHLHSTASTSWRCRCSGCRKPLVRLRRCLSTIRPARWRRR